MELVEIVWIGKEMREREVMMVKIDVEVGVVCVCEKCGIGKWVWKVGMYGVVRWGL